MGNIEKFDSIANQYDNEDRIKISKIISDAICEYIIDGKNKRAMDYGCGTGLVGMNLLNEFSSILFVDASHNMVEKVLEKIKEFHIENADAMCLDLVNECPSDLHADYIIMAQVLLHIKEVDVILSNLYNILNKDGHLLIVDFDKNEDIISSEVQNGFDQGQLINKLQNIGFAQLSSKTFYHGEKMFMNKDASLFILNCVK